MKKKNLNFPTPSPITAGVLQTMTTIEGGPGLCAIYENDFYKLPLWVSESLTQTEGMKYFAFKLHREDTPPTRIFMTPKWARPLRPEARFNPNRVRYSYTRFDWYRHKSQADRTIISQAIYNTTNCPTITIEFGHSMADAMAQTVSPTNAKKTGQDAGPFIPLAFYRFIAPVVYVLSPPSPCPKAIFQLIEHPDTGVHAYVCYRGGVTKAKLDAMLIGANPVFVGAHDE